MDGMFYRRQNENRSDVIEPSPRIGRLLLVTVVAAVCVVGVLVLLQWCGASLVPPAEFPVTTMDPN